MSDGQIGHGIVFERGDQASPEVWEKIGKITEPAFPSPSRETAETTHSESPNRWREKIGSLRDGGEVAPTLLLEPGDAAYQALVDDLNNDEAVHYRTVSPDGTQAWDFMAYLTALEHETPIDDTMTVSPTLTITGQPQLVTLP